MAHSSSSKTQAALAKYAKNRFLSAYLKGTLYVSFIERIHLKSFRAKARANPKPWQISFVSHFRIAYLGQRLSLYYMVYCACWDWLHQLVGFLPSFMAKEGKGVWKILAFVQVLIYFNLVRHWLRKWRTLVWVWSGIPVTELFLTRLCFNVGILSVVYLWESRISGQQEDMLPVYLLPSCWASIMLEPRGREAGGTTTPLEGPAEETCLLSGEEGSQQEGRKHEEARETLVKTGSLSLRKAGPRPCFRGHVKESFHILFSVSLCTCLAQNPTVRCFRPQRNGRGGHCSKATFSSLFCMAYPADLRFPYLQLSCSTTKHKIHTEALWHVYFRRKGGRREIQHRRWLTHGPLRHGEMFGL